MDSGKGFLGTCEPHCPVRLCPITAITMGAIARDAGLTPQEFRNR
jgi:hypothetical protein